MSLAEQQAALLPPQLIAKLERLELVTRKIFRGRMKGERRSRRKGQSVEFADFRNYVPGDDLRHIDWNLFARLEKLFLKLFLEEEDLRFYALIDTSSSMLFGDPRKVDHAKQIAAALAYVGLCRADRVKVEALATPLRGAPQAFRGKHQSWRMVDAIAQLPIGNISLQQGVRNFCLRNPGKGILVFISDLMDKQGFDAALRFLGAQQLDVYVIHILSQEELDPDVKGDLKLIDCEDQDEAEITVSGPLLEKYKATVASFIESARDFCHRRGMSYLMASTQMPVDELVGSYLRRRGLVR